MQEAILYKKMDRNTVRCGVCSHRCVIRDGARGLCGVRENLGGELFALNYDKVIATHVDPIEKKPLFHFKPGSLSFSIATVGCNFNCSWCQNHDISQYSRGGILDLPGNEISPQAIAEAAKESKCATVAYTYTEPTIFAELALDTAHAVAELGIDSVFVSNGYMTHDLIDSFDGLIKAANIDLKGFDDAKYRKYTSGKLQPVLDNIRYLHETGTKVEVTTLIIPEYNDTDSELASIAEFIYDTSPDIAWHISAYHPNYKMMDRSRTPRDTLHRAYRLGKGAGLRFVYTGNAYGDSYESTYCPNCGDKIITRLGFDVQNIRIDNGQCRNCGESIPIVF